MAVKRSSSGSQIHHLEPLCQSPGRFYPSSPVSAIAMRPPPAISKTAPRGAAGPVPNLVAVQVES